MNGDLTYTPSSVYVSIDDEIKARIILFGAMREGLRINVYRVIIWGTEIGEIYSDTDKEDFRTVRTLVENKDASACTVAMRVVISQMNIETLRNLIEKIYNHGLDDGKYQITAKFRSLLGIR